MDLGNIKNRVDFGILTIRDDEFEAVLDRFPDELGVVSGRREYNVRRLVLTGNDAYTIAVVRCIEQGNTEAQLAASALLDEVEPKWLLIVGIAGGIPADEYTLGDVIVSTRILDFSIEAVLKDGSREYALAGGPLHPRAAAIAANLKAHRKELAEWSKPASIGREQPIVDTALKNFYGTKKTKNATRDSLSRHFNGQPRTTGFTTGPIVSSDRLIKNAELIEIWRKSARQIRAVEMESAGVYRVAHERQAPFLAIRGLSDIVGFSRHPDWTEYACHSAAAFTRAFLLTRPIPPHGADKASGGASTSVASNPSSSANSVQGPPRVSLGTKEAAARSLRPEDSTPFFHERMSDAFPGVDGLLVVRNKAEAIARLGALLADPLVVTNYSPIWEIGDGQMEIKSFRAIDERHVLIRHHRYRVHEIVGYRSLVYWHDFVILRWYADDPTGLYSVRDTKEITEFVEKYGRYTEEYGVWGDQLVTRAEYDDQRVFRDGKLQDAQSQLQVRQLSSGYEFIAAQRSPLNDPRFDRERWAWLTKLRKGEASYEDVANWVESLPKHRREDG